LNYKFVETTEFTQRIVKLGLEKELAKLQKDLNQNATKGATDSGTGGLRKVRIADPTRGQGKSFGARVHYVVAEQRRIIYLVFVYGKGESDKLTVKQKKVLAPRVRALMEER
jgi:hypothetical protein